MEQLADFRTQKFFGHPLCLPDINCMRMKQFTSNKMVHPTLPLRWHEQHWLNFSRPMDKTKRGENPTLTWINPAWLSLVEVFKGCSVSYKASNTRIITGRNWRVVCSHPSTHHDWHLPLVCWIQHSLDIMGTISNTCPNSASVTNPSLCEHQIPTSDRLCKEPFFYIEVFVHTWNTLIWYLSPQNIFFDNVSR